MKLFTDQGHDLRTFNDKIKCGLSPYANCPKISTAKAQLYDQVLHEDQVIWCSHAQLPEEYSGKTRYIHMIDADDRDIVATVNTFVWENGILGLKIISTQIRNDLWRPCTASEPKAKQDEHTTKLQSYIADNLPEKPWDFVRSPVKDEEMSQVLLKWPFLYSRIVCTQEYS